MDLSRWTLANVENWLSQYDSLSREIQNRTDKIKQRELVLKRKDQLTGVAVTIPLKIETKGDRIEFNEQYYSFREIINELNEICNVISNKQKSICIGKAHTIVLTIQDKLKAERKFKSAIMGGEGCTYIIRTIEIFDFIRNNNVKLDNSIFRYNLSSQTENKPHLQYVDIRHIIELKDNWTMYEAWKVLKEFIRLHDLTEKTTTDISKLF